MYLVTKTYGNEEGLSCVFRQWKAHGHCRNLHGYALGFKITFACAEEELTPEGWVVDFGELDTLREYLHLRFDHKLMVAKDDPQRERLVDLNTYSKDKHRHIATVMVVDAVGCEAFAKMVYEYVRDNISSKVVQVNCFEHGANSASYSLLTGDKDEPK